MAKAKGKNKKTALKQFLIIVGALIGVELAFMGYFSMGTEQPLTPREAIKKAIAKQGKISGAKKDQVALQLAVADFMAKNGGKPPESLAVLIPAYFDSIPIDPTTKQPYKYRVEGTRFFVGSEETSGASGGTKQASASGVPSDERSQKALIALLDPSAPDPDADYVYDPAQKRDPFRPFDFAPKVVDDGSKTPLELYEIGQLKLTAVLGDGSDGTAMVENEAGKGFPVKKGTKIGTKGGTVVEIQPDKLLILETETDFTGATKNRTVELRLRTKDIDPKRR